MNGPATGERGVSLVALAAAVAILLIGMTVMMPTWHYVAQNEREEELLFRGTQIAKAIIAYKARNNNAGPPSLEALVKNRPRYLRKLYKDPMTEKGEWRILRGEVCPAPKAAQCCGSVGGFVTLKQPTGQAFGPISGVVSTSTAKSLRIVWGYSQYSEWCFLANARLYPPVIGKQPQTATGLPGSQPLGGATPYPH